MRVEKLPFAETNSFSAFFLDYIQQKETLKKFYSQFPEKKNFNVQIENKKQSFPASHRSTLVSALQNQYKNLVQQEIVKSNISLLAQSNTFTVTTGHQLNIFTGPLYFIYKIITGYLTPVENKQIVSIKWFGPAKELIHHGRVVFQDGVGSSQLIIPQHMEPGNYQFVSYVETNASTPRLIFYQGYITVASKKSLHTDVTSSQLKEDTTRSFIVTDRETYERRSKVELSIDVEGLSTPASTAVSITVYNEQLFKDLSKVNVTSIVDGVAMKQDADQIQNSSKLSGFLSYFKGKVVNASGQSAPDSTKITFYLSANDFAYNTYTQSDGNFSFPLFSNYRDENVFYHISYQGKQVRDSKIVLHDVTIEDELIKSSRSDSLNAYGAYVKQKQFINRSYHYFVSKEKMDKSENQFASDVEADKEILLEKYEPFSSMAEVFSTIVPSTRYRRSGDEETIRIFLERNSKYGTNDPLYIVNGVMTDNTKFVLGLDPKSVRKIGVLWSQESLTRFGDLGLDGMLVIEADIPVTSEMNSVHNLSVVGIDKAIGYQSISHAMNHEKSKLPDLRSCLYWNPNINLNKTNSFDFYTADDIGYYIIQVAGIIDGQPFLTTKRIYVATAAD